MSIKLMSAVWQLELNHTEKLVFLALADCANDDGVCWPSLSKIASKCSMTNVGICRIIKRLRENKFLTTKKRFGSSTIYKILLPDAMNSPVLTQDQYSINPGLIQFEPRVKRETSAETSIKLARQKKDVFKEVCEDEILPPDWHTFAESKNIPDEQIYISWKKFKDVSRFPWKYSNWCAWISKERIKS